MRSIDKYYSDEDIKKYHDEYFLRENMSNIFFLNGKWGSGKSFFMKRLVDYNQDLDDDKKKISWIYPWEHSINRKPIKQIYRSIYPITGFFIDYIFIIASIIFAVLIPILPQILLPLGAGSFMVGVGSLTVVAILSAAKGFFGNINKEEVFLKSLNFRVGKKYLDLCFKNKVLIIDDFDRLEQEHREALYLVFRALSTKKIIVFFLGDYNALIAQTDTELFLQKIIDERLDLPNKVSPTVVWDKYMTEVASKLKSESNRNVSALEENNLLWLRDYACRKGFTIRSKERVEVLVNQWIFGIRKDQINIDQQILVLYLYENEPIAYEWLLNHIKFIEDVVQFEESNNKSLVRIDATVKERRDALIKDNLGADMWELIRDICYERGAQRDYPSFRWASSRYLPNDQYEKVTNLDIQTLLSDEKDLVKLSSAISIDEHSAFYNYLRWHLYKLDREKQKEIVERLLLIYLDALKDSDGVGSNLQEVAYFCVSQFNSNKTEDKFFVDFINNLEGDISIKARLMQLCKQQDYISELPDFLRKEKSELVSLRDPLCIVSVALDMDYSFYEEHEDAILIVASYIDKVAAVKLRTALDFKNEPDFSKKYLKLSNLLKEAFDI